VSGVGEKIYLCKKCKTLVLGGDFVFRIKHIVCRWCLDGLDDGEWCLEDLKDL
jgi:hypothetical protein